MKKALIVGYGLFTHLCFLLGVALMFYQLYFGLCRTFVHIDFCSPVLWNTILLFHFPFLHSFFLTGPGRRLMGSEDPLFRILMPTSYALLASLQLIFVFGTWQSSEIIWWQASGIVSFILSSAYIFSWVYLGMAMSDAGLGYQTGFSGWWSALGLKSGLSQMGKFTMPEKRTFSVTRQPIYLSFALILWTSPVWSPDRGALTLVWTLYCLFGPLHKERRYLRYFGDTFRDYQKRVPYFFPGIARRNKDKNTA
ncbi:MAG: isoprenylcysteine carboxylmethyltransferase family protein [bacterium]|nr:isoprenylcysteine carboxylmethyltransferase family protein [bacterium]